MGKESQNKRFYTVKLKPWHKWFLFPYIFNYANSIKNSDCMDYSKENSSNLSLDNFSCPRNLYCEERGSYAWEIHHYLTPLREENLQVYKTRGHLEKVISYKYQFGLFTSKCITKASPIWKQWEIFSSASFHLRLYKIRNYKGKAILNLTHTGVTDGISIPIIIKETAWWNLGT